MPLEQLVESMHLDFDFCNFPKISIHCFNDSANTSVEKVFNWVEGFHTH